MQISTIGIDLAKTVFQVHGVDAADKPVLDGYRLQIVKDGAALRSAPCGAGGLSLPGGYRSRVRPYHRDRGGTGNEVIFAGSLNSIVVKEDHEYLTEQPRLQRGRDQV